MKDQVSNGHTREGTQNFETRVAIDVMFEVLSHIQASIDASSEEERPGFMGTVIVASVPLSELDDGCRQRSSTG